MADEELSLDEGGSTKGAGKKKLIIIIIAALLILGGGGAGAYFFLSSGDSDESAEKQPAEESVNYSGASYVAMPRPFVFNVMDGDRDRLVQIKVQLLVRGTGNVALAKKHIPLLEGTLVRIFGAATAPQLRNPEGKDQLREAALEALNEATQKLEGEALIDTVLFTGFVLQ
ncbi:MAG: flagellar basal body-associated protein FliL [Psychromonas sp.]